MVETSLSHKPKKKRSGNAVRAWLFSRFNYVCHKNSCWILLAASSWRWKSCLFWKCSASALWWYGEKEDEETCLMTRKNHCFALTNKTTCKVEGESHLTRHRMKWFWISYSLALHHSHSCWVRIVASIVASLRSSTTIQVDTLENELKKLHILQMQS